jgi:hypothetical protein
MFAPLLYVHNAYTVHTMEKYYFGLQYWAEQTVPPRPQTARHQHKSNRQFIPTHGTSCYLNQIQEYDVHPGSYARILEKRGTWYLDKYG